MEHDEQYVLYVDGQNKVKQVSISKQDAHLQHTN
jgi:hypothetical protein